MRFEHDALAFYGERKSKIQPQKEQQTEENPFLRPFTDLDHISMGRLVQQKKPSWSLFSVFILPAKELQHISDNQKFPPQSSAICHRMAGDRKGHAQMDGNQQASKQPKQRDTIDITLSSKKSAFFSGIIISALSRNRADNFIRRGPSIVGCAIAPEPSRAKEAAASCA